MQVENKTGRTVTNNKWINAGLAILLLWAIVVPATRQASAAGAGLVKQISAGFGYSLALKTDGTVYGWGNGSNGRLDIPANLNNVVAIATGHYLALALKSDGSIVAWGGVGISSSLNVPSGLNDVVAIDAGEFYSLALKNNGTVAAWAAGSDPNPEIGRAHV